jgi:hypothetical protein
MISDELYIPRPISRHGHVGDNLHTASVSPKFKSTAEGLGD